MHKTSALHALRSLSKQTGSEVISVNHFHEMCSYLMFTVFIITALGCNDQG